jgi:hypothetical protein
MSLVLFPSVLLKLTNAKNFSSESAAATVSFKTRLYSQQKTEKIRIYSTLSVN